MTAWLIWDLAVRRLASRVRLTAGAGSTGRP